jgi:hypothetical protein
MPSDACCGAHPLMPQRRDRRHPACSRRVSPFCKPLTPNPHPLPPPPPSRQMSWVIQVVKLVRGRRGKLHIQANDIANILTLVAQQKVPSPPLSLPLRTPYALHPTLYTLRNDS